MAELSKGDGEGQGVASDAASAADARRSAFMRDLVHDLSTPLTPIAGYLTLLRGERMGPLTAQQRKAIETMAGAVVRLTRIVENLSDLASLQAGPSAIRAGPVHPDELAEAAASELQAAAQESRLHLEVRTAGGGEIMGDARKLRQAHHERAPERGQVLPARGRGPARGEPRRERRPLQHL